MVRVGCIRYGACILALAFAATVSKAQDVWIGSFPDDNISSPTNWVGGVVPPGYMSGTDVLEFTSDSNSNMFLDVAGVSFAQVDFEATDGTGSINLYGTNAITIGCGGILLHQVEDGGSAFLSSAPIILGANQTWEAAYDGYIEVSGVISGPGALTLSGNNDQTYQFDNGGNTFSGGLTVTGTGVTLALGASGTPLGTGPVLIGDDVALQPTVTTPITIPNNITFGDESNGNPVTLGGSYYSGLSSTSLVFTGNVTFDANGDDESYSTIRIQPNTQVTFSGSMDGAFEGASLEFVGSEETENSVVIARGTFGPNIDVLDLYEGVSLILDGSGVSQFANIGSIQTDYNTYLGLGAAYVGHVSDFLDAPQVDEGSFNGTLGFDNTTGGVSHFTDDIDLTNFEGDFVGLGSATKGQATGASNVILSGSITPPGGLNFTGVVEPSGSDYPFGGGGGTLQVTSSLTDGDWYDGEVHRPVENGLELNPGNGPLTLILSGALTYSGNSFVSGGALIIDTPFPTGTSIGLGVDDADGYAGSTLNSGFLNDDSGAVGTHPQDFINLVVTSSEGVVGFDDLSGGTRTISGAIDMSAFSGLYLGTATKVNYSGTINPYDGIFMFSGVKGGQVTVTTPSISGTSSVVVGLPTPIESFGSVSSVIMPGSSYYSGNTTLNSGYLYVGTANSIGNGTLIVPGTSGDVPGTVGLAPYMGSVTVMNQIQIPNQGLHLNYAGSPYGLFLTGTINDFEGNGSLIVDGPVSISGNNNFSGYVTVNGTSLGVDSNEALNNSNGVIANAGSTIDFTTDVPYVETLALTNSSATFAASSTPEIDELSMAMGSQVTFLAGSHPTVYAMDSDEPNSGNVITLGVGTGLTFDFDDDPDYHGTFVGDATSSVTIQSGELNLSGNSTAFSGAVTVGAYGLLVASNDNALGSGTVTVQENGALATNTGITLSNRIALQDGGILAGFGAYNGGNALTVKNGSEVIAGSATLGDYGTPASIPIVGTLTFGAATPLTFDGGGKLVFALQDAGGAAGTGYGTVVANGGLGITATNMDQFTISIISFSPGSTGQGNPAANFNSSAPYSWTLVSSPTAITGFDPTAFYIDPSLLGNDLGGGLLSVSVNADNLVLNFTPVPEPSTWAMIGLGTIAFGAFAFRRSRRTA